MKKRLTEAEAKTACEVLMRMYGMKTVEHDTTFYTFWALEWINGSCVEMDMPGIKPGEPNPHYVPMLRKDGQWAAVLGGALKEVQKRADKAKRTYDSPWHALLYILQHAKVRPQ